MLKQIKRQASRQLDSLKVQSESALTRASLKVAGWRPGEGVRQVITIQMMEPGHRQMVGGGGRHQAGGQNHNCHIYIS